MKNWRLFGGWISLSCLNWCHTSRVLSRLQKICHTFSWYRNCWSLMLSQKILLVNICLSPQGRRGSSGEPGFQGNPGLQVGWCHERFSMFFFKISLMQHNVYFDSLPTQVFDFRKTALILFHFIRRDLLDHKAHQGTLDAQAEGYVRLLGLLLYLRFNYWSYF